MNYTTKDFTKIYPGNVKPTIPGWYPTDACFSIGSDRLEKIRALEHPDPGSTLWWYFEDGVWFTDNDKTCEAAGQEDIRWFGLNKDPHKK